MKKILIVGGTLEVGRTEEVYQRGFRAAGYEVKTCVMDQVSPWLDSRSLPVRVLRKLGEPWLLEPFNRQVRNEARRFRPDLSVVIAPKIIKPATVRALREHGPAITFFTDNPLDSHRTHRNAWQDSCLPLWDATLIWSHHWTKRLEEAGVRRAVFHAFCSDTEHLRPLPPPAKGPEYDVVFIGNWDDSGEREAYMQALGHVRLGLWGGDDWVRRAGGNLARFYRGRARYLDIPGILGSARVALNLMRPQNVHGHNIRTYEIPACGKLMLSERTSELPGLFAEDQEAVYFSSPEELRAKVDALLGQPAEIERVAAAGLRRALANPVAKRIEEIAALRGSL